MKGGRKWAERTEEKKSSRIGQSLTRTFIVNKLSREAIRVLYTTQEYVPLPGEYLSMREPMEEANRQITGVHPYTTQEGYQIIPDEGGEPYGPFWDKYRGYDLIKEGEEAALAQVWKVLKDEQRRVAKDLAFGG